MEQKSKDCENYIVTVAKKNWNFAHLCNILMNIRYLGFNSRSKTWYKSFISVTLIGLLAGDLGHFDIKERMFANGEFIFWIAYDKD